MFALLQDQGPSQAQSMGPQRCAIFAASAQAFAQASGAGVIVPNKV